MEKGLDKFFRWLSGKPSRQEKYDSDFSSERDFLNRYHKGTCLTGKRALSIRNSTLNTLVVGGTGSGKSSVVLTPTLLRADGSASYIVHDPSGENFINTSGYLQQKNYAIHRLVLSDAEICYTPLSRVKTTADSMKIAHTPDRKHDGHTKQRPFLEPSGKRRHQHVY